MIEQTVISRLNATISGIQAFAEVPETMPDEFLVVAKLGSGRAEYLDSAAMTVHSYAKSLYRAAQINELVKACMDALPQTDDVFAARLNSDYPYPDTEIKRYRYQAVYDIYF